MIVLKQSAAFAFADNFSTFQDVGAPSQVEWRLNVLFHDEQTHPLPVQFRENRKDRLDDLGVSQGEVRSEAAAVAAPSEHAQSGALLLAAKVIGELTSRLQTGGERDCMAARCCG